MVMAFNYDVFFDMVSNGEKGDWYFDFDIFDDVYIAEGESVIAMLVGVKAEDCSAILLVSARKEVGEYERVGIVGMKYRDFEDAEPWRWISFSQR
jgi:hypothetical protein